MVTPLKWVGQEDRTGDLNRATMAIHQPPDFSGMMQGLTSFVARFQRRTRS